MNIKGTFCSQTHWFSISPPFYSLINSIYLGCSVSSNVREKHLCPDISEHDSGYK